jgi:hypothetical protein
LVWDEQVKDNVLKELTRAWVGAIFDFLAVCQLSFVNFEQVLDELLPFRYFNAEQFYFQLSICTALL